jgi:NADPH:quinone reductase-like Zn-dependent oxidoreductase
MRAVTFSRFGGPEVLEVSELPAPQPGPGEVRIRVAAATVNPTDISFRTGRQQTTAQLAEMGVRPPLRPRHGAGRGGGRRRRGHGVAHR